MGTAWLRMQQSSGEPLVVRREFEILDAEVADRKLLEMRARSELPKMAMMLAEVLLRGGYQDEAGPHMIQGFVTFNPE